MRYPRDQLEGLLPLITGVKLIGPFSLLDEILYLYEQSLRYVCIL